MTFLLVPKVGVFLLKQLRSQEPKYESQMMEIQDTFLKIENCVIHLISPEI